MIDLPRNEYYDLLIRLSYLNVLHAYIRPPKHLCVLMSINKHIDGITFHYLIPSTLTLPPIGLTLEGERIQEGRGHMWITSTCLCMQLSYKGITDWMFLNLVQYNKLKSCVTHGLRLLHRIGMDTITHYIQHRMKKWMTTAKYCSRRR